MLGATDNPARYSFLAIQQLRKKGIAVEGIGRKAGRAADVDIITGKKPLKDIDTITLYLNPLNQQEYYDYILSLQPRRIIFNPGTENPELEELAKAKGIQTMEACTLVMLSTGQY